MAVPGVFGDLLVSVIERNPGFHLTARAKDLARVVRPSGDPELHAIIVCTPAGSIPAAERLLESGACRAMVAISADGKDAWLHGPRGDRRPLRDLSPDGLLSAVRAAVSGEEEAADA